MTSTMTTASTNTTPAMTINAAFQPSAPTSWGIATPWMAPQNTPPIMQMDVGRWRFVTSNQRPISLGTVAAASAAQPMPTTA